jgi:hypothetical protein
MSTLGNSQTKFFGSVKPEATVVVRKHTLGADLVQITLINPSYDPEALRSHIELIGKELKSIPRGVEIFPSGGMFLKATFAVDGLIKSTEPNLGLVPLARGLAFGSSPIKSFSVYFEGVSPGPTMPSRYFAPNDAWMLEGVPMMASRISGIEYRVQVNTKEPEKVELPGREVAVQNKEEKLNGKKPDFFMIGGIILGAIAAGLLVYSAAIRTRKRSN